MAWAAVDNFGGWVESDVGVGKGQTVEGAVDELRWVVDEVFGRHGEGVGG